jgi:aconitate hydratase
VPLQFLPGQNAQTLALTGQEKFEITGLGTGDARTVAVTATPPQGKAITFPAKVRIDTPKEREYFRHGGILHYVLRQLARAA